MEMTALYLEQQALLASFALNKELLEDNSAWGYSGSKDDFDRLYEEVRAITQMEGIDPGSIEEICEAFWDIQLEVINGTRAVGWHL